jgi:sulfofructose kinase
MARLLCLGMSALDAIYQVEAIPKTPTKILATGFIESGGGMAASASVGAARLGGQVAYWGRVGDDPLGTRILAELAAEGIDVTAVRRVPGCVSPSAAILVAPDGERLVCAYNDPALDHDPDWLPLAAVAGFDAVMVDVRWPAGAAKVLDAARAAGKVSVLDADIGPLAAFDELLPRAGIVAFSEPGLARACGDGPAGEALRRAATRTSATVGVTLGPDGFLWLDRGREQRAPAPKVTAVDTLAAGDVWHGAFTLRLAEGADIATAARFANTAAALKCTRFGGRNGAPRRDEVERFLAADGPSRA